MFKNELSKDTSSNPSLQIKTKNNDLFTQQLYQINFKASNNISSTRGRHQYTLTKLNYLCK